MKDYDATEQAFKNGYEKGYRDGYSAGYRKVEQGEWVSVEDRLPKTGEKVLGINSDGEFFLATYIEHKISPSARGYNTWASNMWNGKPTHWMPLPQPPKMKGE